jgi:acetoin utilization protein AcuB
MYIAIGILYQQLARGLLILLAMNKTTPSIKNHMTSQPHSIRPDATLLDAHRSMREHHIRHLPVLSGGTLLGLVSQRDLHLIESLKDVDPAKVTVEEAMSQDVYRVQDDAPLAEVVAHMAEHKLGSAVVLHDHKVVGIFTITDAMNALAHFLSPKG